MALIAMVSLSGAQAVAAPTTHHVTTVGAPIPSGFTVMPGSYGRIPLGLVPVAQVPTGSAISFNIEMGFADQAQVQAYLNGISTQGSPTFGEKMPGVEFVSLYGAQPTTVRALQSYFESYGLQVRSIDQLGLLYSVSGNVGEADAALHTTLWTYSMDGTGPAQMAPSISPSLPTSLAPWVEGFHGLNAFDSPHPVYTALPHITSAMVVPSQMQGAYDATPLLTGGDTGSANTIGLSEMCDPGETNAQYQSDVNSFDSTYSLASDTLTFSGSGSTSCTTGSSGWGTETDLDIQWSHVIAPGASVNVCLDNTDPSVCDSSFVSSSIPFGSNSWGGGGPYHSIWQSAMAAGINLLASSGDSCLAVNYPAAEPDGLGVGGTSLTISGSASYGGETAWSCSGGSGTGGGCDTADAPPSYQIGMTGYPGICGSTSDRGDPDVGMDADPNTGVPVVTPSGTIQVGGTSLACPMWAATLDLIAQKASLHLAFMPPNLYALAKSSAYSTDFHDVTSGSNGDPATVGWDPDTGVGSPDINNLAVGWVAPLSAGGLTATPTTVEAGGTVVLAVTASGGTSPYSYSWTVNSTSVASTTTNTYNWIPLHSSPTPYSVGVTVSDSASHSATATPVSVTVNPGPTVVFSATPAAVDGGQKVTMSATPSGGSGGYSYTWTLNGTQIGTSTGGSYGWTAPSHSFTATLGTRVFDSAGGSAIATASIPVYMSPSVAFSATPLGPVDVLMPVNLSAIAEGGDPASITYTFVANGTTVLHTGSAPYYNWFPSGASTYMVSATTTDALGVMAYSSHANVTVNPSPQVSVGLPSPAIVDVGQYAKFQAMATGGTGCCSYKWSINGVVVAGATSATYQFHTTTAGTVQAQVVAVDSLGRGVTSSVASLTVNPDPVVKLLGATSVEAGVTDTLTASVQANTGTPQFSYQFTVDSVPLSTQQADTYAFSSTTVGPHSVLVQVTDGAGNVVTANATINVTPVPAWYETPFIPGTSSAMVSWGIVVAVIAVVVAALAVAAARRRKRDRAASAPPPQGAPPGAPGFCGSCGAPTAWGAPACGQCGAPTGGMGWAPSPGAPPGYYPPQP